MEIRKDDYLITDDKEKINIDFVVNSLHKTYWANNRTREIIINSIDNSIFISLFKNKKQIGFTRIVTDKAAFAWIADVFIDEKHRGNGLGKWLVKTTTNHPSIKNVSLQLLKTRDAHSLYEKFGFKKDDCLTKRKK
ncbi:hypothetical protein U472_09675 [Orenia metallireducens]|uniref:N-acetyltransferase domain-containing protein n=1 Tax=Orenia metallireducens TaxID=1413210 RepID=A0A1C0A7R9_9FIRM|nr:GNAT family N-acetyltransferase [Orenia metallireducens]OCL26270.1 hypothetical protein U472_09675 [Orenia metallireducens]